MKVKTDQIPQLLSKMKNRISHPYTNKKQIKIENKRNTNMWIAHFLDWFSNTFKKYKEIKWKQKIQLFIQQLEKGIISICVQYKYVSNANMHAARLLRSSISSHFPSSSQICI